MTVMVGWDNLLGTLTAYVLNYRSSTPLKQNSKSGLNCGPTSFLSNGLLRFLPLAKGPEHQYDHLHLMTSLNKKEDLYKYNVILKSYLILRHGLCSVVHNWACCRKLLPLIDHIITFIWGTNFLCVDVDFMCNLSVIYNLKFLPVETFCSCRLPNNISYAVHKYIHDLST
jgi:hypothetical protein